MTIFKKELRLEPVANKLSQYKEKWLNNFIGMEALDTQNNSLTIDHDSSVGIALGYGLNDRGSRVRFPAGLGIFLFTTVSITALRPTQPPIQWIPGTFPWG
jgi:hypothetical protein